MEVNFPRGKFTSSHTKCKIKNKYTTRRTNIKKISRNKDISNDILITGTSVLSVVSFINNFEIHVSLPNNRKGVISITNISDEYTKLLQATSAKNINSKTDIEKILSLHDIFHPGMTLRCTILEIDNIKKSTRVILTINPKIMHKDIDIRFVPIFTGIVSSCEDHGFILDIGQTNLSTFISKKESEKYLIQLSKLDIPIPNEFSIGLYLNCIALSSKLPDQKSINISIDFNKLKLPISEDKIPISIQNILPGTILAVNVIKIYDTHIIVACNHLSGSISRTHLLSNFKSYKIGQELKVVLLYVHPIKRTLILSELNHLLNFYQSENIFKNLNVGDLIENAEIISIKKNYGIYLKIAGFLRLFAKWSQISSNNIAPNYKKGDLIKCRIVDLNFFDKIIMVSLRQDIIDQQFLRLDDINTGDILICQVKKTLSTGIVVSLFGNINGFIPNIQISDIPLKNLKKKYLPGKKIKCKVMQNDNDSHKLILTHKKSLMKSKYPILCNYNEVDIGKLVTGFVGKIMTNGLVMIFFNNVKGFVPISELSYNSFESPEKNYYIGQVINCKVKSYNVKNDKLLLTLKISNKSGVIIQETLFQPGMMIDCIVVKQTNLGLYLTPTISNIEAFLPSSHLSDFFSNCDMSIKLFEPNDVINNCMIIENKNEQLILTKKKSIITMIQAENFLTDFNELIIDKVYYGFVKKKIDSGVLVQIGGLTGLVLKKYIVDVPHPDPVSLLAEGQTIIGKVKNIDVVNSRFLITLRLESSDINKMNLEFLDDYLYENNDIRKKLLAKNEYENLKKYSIGKLVKIKITSINNIGVLGMVNDDTSAFIINDNLDKITCQVNHSYDAVIIYIDIISKILQLSLDKFLVKGAKSFSKNKCTNLLPQQIIKSEVQLINHDFILVSLKNHGLGQFAYVPAKKHFSDFIEKLKFNIGQENKVVIKKIDENGYILGTLEINEIKDTVNLLKTTKIGDILEATVKDVLSFQINIITKFLSGRIHITEIVDNLSESPKNVMSEYKINDKLKVKVIGYNDDKNYRMLECTIKPSKLNQSLDNYIHDNTIENLKVNDLVIGFITSINDNGIFLQLSRNLKGFVNFLNIFQTIDNINNAKQLLQIGLACKTWVLSIVKGSIQLTMIEKIPKAGDIVIGKILKRFSNHLFLQLPMNNIGNTSFYDEINIPNDVNFVICKILKPCAGPKIKFIVTINQNKFDGEQNKSVKLPKKSYKEVQVNKISSSNDAINVSTLKSLKRKASLLPKSFDNLNYPKSDHLVLPSRFNWNEDELINVNSDNEIEDPIIKKVKSNLKQNESEMERLRYEKILCSDSNSSSNWIKFITFELGNNELDRARSIAERALKTISYREETEKLNIWVAYINIENNYGNEESLRKVIERAKQSSDPFKIECHLKDIYANDGKLNEAIDICKSLIKRHKHNLEAWFTFANLLFKFGKLQEARDLLIDCLQKIDLKDRIEAAMRFAQLESKYGVAECGETLLEDVLKNFPKRTDVWSVYADMCIKNGHTDQARQVLERATSLDLNPKKMKFLFDKYLAFETKFGNKVTMNMVREKAVKYAKKST